MFHHKCSARFTTLQIYTILKLKQFFYFENGCFTTLQIYTILKRWGNCYLWGFRFYYLIDLHYSQTQVVHFVNTFCFTTLQIYTILKLNNAVTEITFVLLPYRFTLFSNYNCREQLKALVLLPYRFTLFSNLLYRTSTQLSVLLPYRFTLFSNYSQGQDNQGYVLLPYRFTLFSNSKLKARKDKLGFTTLQIYTILKHNLRTAEGLQVLLPYRFTLFSNPVTGNVFNVEFYYLIDLHYSQTSNRE